MTNENQSMVPFDHGEKPTLSTRDLIVVGTSAGGVEALQILARGLPKDLPAAVLVVMHTGPQGPYLLPQILQKVDQIAVGKAVEGVLIEHGKIYIAPPDHHLLIQQNRINLSKGPKENRARPAIDPLFRSAATAYGSRVVGVILTGGLDDGTAGLWAVKELGGTTVVQDPKDALSPSMPQNALRHVEVDYVLPLSEIAPLLVRLVTEPAVPAKKLSISRRNQIESKFAAMGKVNIEDMDAIGSHAGISCPECHGPIWKIKDGTLQRYRCHVGHAYGAQTIAQGQIEAQEIHLWQALRLMKERITLIWELRCHAENDDRGSAAEYYDGKIEQLQKNVALLQDMIQQEELSVGIDEPAL